MSPLNLAQTPPRGPRVEVAGIVFTARLIDKLRAALPGGVLDGYVPFTGFSLVWQHYTGVDLHDFQRVVAAAATEDEIGAWLAERTTAVDRKTINAKMQNFPTSRTPESMREMFEAFYPAELRARHAVIFDLLEADDARLLEARNRTDPHAGGYGGASAGGGVTTGRGAWNVDGGSDAGN